LIVNKHILEVFVHLDEGKDEKDLLEITKNRVYNHTNNAIALLKGNLSKFAGKGIRQGKEDVGSIDGGN